MNQATQSSTKPSSNSDTLNVIKKIQESSLKLFWIELNTTDHNYFYDKNFDGKWVKVAYEKWNSDVKI